MCSTSCCCCCSLTSMWIREMPIFTKSCGNEKQHQQPRSKIQLKIYTSSEQSGNENIHTLNDHYQVNSVFKIAVQFVRKSISVSRAFHWLEFRSIFSNSNQSSILLKLCFFLFLKAVKDFFKRDMQFFFEIFMWKKFR